MDVLNRFVNELFKKKMKKINILIIFYIYHKNDIKIF